MTLTNRKNMLARNNINSGRFFNRSRKHSLTEGVSSLWRARSLVLR